MISHQNKYVNEDKWAPSRVYRPSLENYYELKDIHNRNHDESTILMSSRSLNQRNPFAKTEYQQYARKCAELEEALSNLELIADEKNDEAYEMLEKQIESL